MEGLDGGLAALAFWGFIATIIVAGTWDGAKKREAQHETLRRIIESGQPLDAEMREKLLGGQGRPDRGLRIGAIIVLSIAPGMVILGLFVSEIERNALWPLIGIGGLLVCIGIGLLVASVYVRRSMTQDAAPANETSTSG